MSNPSIAEMLAALPPGEQRVYPPAEQPSDDHQRFFEVHRYGIDIPALNWADRGTAPTMPFLGSRLRRATDIDVIDRYVARLDGRAADIGDFYSTDSDIYFLSPRLVDLIATIDAGAIVHRPARVVATDKDLDFRAAMPARLIESVDPQRTEVTVNGTVFPSGKYFAKASFGGDVCFRADIPPNVHAFRDPDLYFWHWSKSLLEVAKEQGMRGIYANQMTRARPRWIWM
ncbi:imm11 family protein [Sphingomonas xinjiangensis]|uniref:Immunity MXAN-0049 protein domain-containing protein n=1 Tax=Sphingomonas xinjiangensis TaxID=643568 RepID=A0A840YTJ1_9SPHN|nr:DUF1629 domain-containing protein [Sphingomonas xinjiangensis]MBB5713004.1 hypothetical protein [Sphingomonas xinjiangensis]